MTVGLYPISELGVLWLQATLCVAAVWLFLRVQLLPVIVATASVYVVTILAWMLLVHFDAPTVWNIHIEEREYPVGSLVALGLVTAFVVLRQMDRRGRRLQARRAASMADAPARKAPRSASDRAAEDTRPTDLRTRAEQATA